MTAPRALLMIGAFASSVNSLVVRAELTSGAKSETRASDIAALVRVGADQNGQWKEAIWEFRPGENGAGIVASAELDETRTEFQLNPGGELGEIVQLCAQVARFGGNNKTNMVVLGVASLNATETEVEYRMVLLQTTRLVPTADRWVFTRALVTRPQERAFDGMFIVFPGGDSVVLGLVDLTRGGEEADQIESHYFVHHCPGGDRNGVISDTATEHYLTFVRGGETVSEFKSKERGKAANTGE